MPTLAWIGAHASSPRPKGFELTFFEDSDEFLLDARSFEFDVYLVDTSQRGVSGIDLVRLLRRHGGAAIISIDALPLPNFRAALDSGADMVVGSDASLVDLEAAISAVLRRAALTKPVSASPWRVSKATLRLETPAGAQIALQESELKILGSFVESGGRPVERRVLVECLWGKGVSGMENALQAIVYRLRKRIESVAAEGLPIKSVAGKGYEFRAGIVWA